jgi:hypothetical protein
MSSGEPRRPLEPVGRPLSFYLTLGFFAVGVGLFLMILLTLSGFGGGTHATTTSAREDDPLDEARETLDHSPDIGACRAALQKVNVALGRESAPRAAPLDSKDRELLQKDFNLSEEEIAEISAENYTLLDGYHLDGAFLLHDAATHALEPEEVGVDLPAPAPLERATAAFAWVVREVRLAEPTVLGLAPPQFVLRRASGTPLERALVYLDLLDQLGTTGDIAEPKEGQAESPPPLLGCLVFCRDKPADAPRLWACGVVLNGGPDVFLFDPRLGMPLPGANGKGVATLAAVCKDASLLKQLDVDAAHPYDVTAEQARTAELQLVCSLSSLAPRMAHLQKKLLPPVRVSLSHDVSGELRVLKNAAAKTEGVVPPVRVLAEGAGVLRRFLPPDEGGADAGWPKPGFPLRDLVGFTNPDDGTRVQMQRLQLFRLQLAPWDVMPAQFHDMEKFPYNVGLGGRVREGFLAPFAHMMVDPQSPRDRMLRGEFDKAATDLVGMSARMRLHLDQRAEAGTTGELEKEVDAWVDKARHAYADQLRAQDKGSPAAAEAATREVDAIWKESTPVVTLLEGASAVPGLADATYLLGLCKHERAEQAQARLDLLARSLGDNAKKSDRMKDVRQDARTAWMDALGWWKKYGDDHPEESPQRPSSSPGRAAAVRQMRARAQAMLGDEKEAATTYEDLTEPMAPLEKVAALYRARRVKTQ